MFSDITYSRLVERMLSRVKNDVDKREGAIVYDAVAPAAAELAILYSLMTGEMDRAFPDTAAGIDLTNKVKERSIFRLPATAAVRQGVFTGENGNRDIPIGSRFSGGTVNYTATQKVRQGVYQMTCEEPGAIGNAYFGNLIPIDYIPGLASATLGEILIPGEDEEDDETLRARYMESLKSTAFGGNIAQYKEQIKQIPGVGPVKVFPTFAGNCKPADLNVPEEFSTWFASASDIPADVSAWLSTVSAAILAGAVTVGGGTVKCVIVDSEGGVPSEALVNNVQTAIDPEVNHGEGLGIAPIGHRAQIEAATGTTVDISFSLVFESGTDWDMISGNVTNVIKDYFRELIAEWEAADHLIVRISQIESRILDISGVLDITGTTINGDAENLALLNVAIPVLGEVVNV